MNLKNFATRRFSSFLVWCCYGDLKSCIYVHNSMLWCCHYILAHRSFNISIFISNLEYLLLVFIFLSENSDFLLIAWLYNLWFFFQYLSFGNIFSCFFVLFLLLLFILLCFVSLFWFWMKKIIISHWLLKDTFTVHRIFNVVSVSIGRTWVISTQSSYMNGSLLIFKILCLNFV